MPAWKPIVGQSFSASAFSEYCHALNWNSWRPSFIVVHNTGVPNLAQRPNGFTRQHIDALVGYYRDQNHWSAGPHLFIDDHQIWVFTPLTTPGVHSPSWNAVALGIEMLGDYSIDSFDSGRGKAVQANAVSAIATLCEVLGFDPGTLRLHKEDKKTTHVCPGKNVAKQRLIDAVRVEMASEGVEHALEDAHPG